MDRLPYLPGGSDTMHEAVVFVTLYLEGFAIELCMMEFRSIRVKVAQGKA